MKKLFLFVTMLSLSLVACSDDDSNSATQPEENLPTAISYKVDGVLKVSNDADILESIDEGRPYMQITSVAVNDANSKIYMEVYEGDTGTGKVQMLYLKLTSGNPITYGMQGVNDQNFTINLLRSDADVVAGTFSGELTRSAGSTGSTESVQITDGTFYINR